MVFLVNRRSRVPISASTSSQTLFDAGDRAFQARPDLSNPLRRSNRISTDFFSFNLNIFSNADSICLLRFEKPHVLLVERIIGWTSTKTATRKNRYYVTAIIFTSVVSKTGKVLLVGLISNFCLKNTHLDFQKSFGMD